VFTEHGQFGLGRRLGVSGRAKQRAQRRFVMRCAAVAANSRWTADRLSATYGIEAERVTVVHNGIAPVTTPVEDPAGRSDGEVKVVFAGRLKRFKRVDRILRAAARVPDPGAVRILIAGGGELEEELRQLSRDLGVDAQVSFLGWRPDIAEVLREADALVLPSEGEPFGLALVEGCAQGLLPIAFADGGGALECMPPDGRVVSDVDDLAATLDEIRRSDALGPAARAARASWALERFPIAKTATRYLELYRSASTGNLVPSP
jgi:glycosyltransferase involved in cell wall biosynthesis